MDSGLHMMRFRSRIMGGTLRIGPLEGGFGQRCAALCLHHLGLRPPRLVNQQRRYNTQARVEA